MEIILILTVVAVAVLWFRGRAENRKFIHAIRIGAARNNADKLKTLGATEAEIQRALDRNSYKRDHQYDYELGLWLWVKGDQIKLGREKAPVAGATASLDYGLDLDREGRNSPYVKVTLADGRHFSRYVGAIHEHKARRLVDAINNASNYYSKKADA